MTEPCKSPEPTLEDRVAELEKKVDVLGKALKHINSRILAIFKLLSEMAEKMGLDLGPSEGALDLPRMRKARLTMKTCTLWKRRTLDRSMLVLTRAVMTGGFANLPFQKGFP